MSSQVGQKRCSYPAGWRPTECGNATVDYGRPPLRASSIEAARRASALIGCFLVLGLLGLLGCGNDASQGADGSGNDPWFADHSVEAGVVHSHHNRSFDNPYAHILEGYTAQGASAAVADYDADGLEDVFFTVSDLGGSNRLYRNNGDFTFTDMAEQAGVAGGNDTENACADALWLDYDNDGDPDLFVVRFGKSLLYENLGDGTFKDVSAEAGFDLYLNSMAVIAFDYDLDSDLDIFLGNYFMDVNLFNPSTSRFFPESFETAENGGGITVYRNEGDGTFTEVTAAVGLKTSGWILDLGHADADHDGDDDLYLAADFGTDSVFRNNADGTFTNVSDEAVGIDTKKGMNVEWADFNKDGLFDVYVTNITDAYMKEGNFLWQNLGDLTFVDVARETGTHDGGWAWAGKFFDYDNDSWLDLYVANGWISGSKDTGDAYILDIYEVIVNPDVDLADLNNWPAIGERSLSGYQKNRLFHAQAGLFKEEAQRHGLDSTLDARGIAVADFDRDGRLDLFVTNAGKPSNLYRNIAPTDNHWVRFKFVGTESNRDAIGARVWIRSHGGSQVGFVNGGNGFASQSSLEVHFGLGVDETLDRVVVAWPSGLRQEFADLPTDRVFLLREGESEMHSVDEPGTTSSEVERGQVVDGTPMNILPGFALEVVGEVLADTGDGLEELDSSGDASSGGESAHELHRRGLAVIAGKDFAAGLEDLEAALSADPGNLRYGTDYRQAVILAAEQDRDAYSRGQAFWEALVQSHPDQVNARLNLAFAYVDAIPVEGSVTQARLAKRVLDTFDSALELEESWLGYFSRGRACLFWPTIFDRAPEGQRDLQRAIQISRTEPARAIHGRTWTALGDAYWKLGDLDKAREVWGQGLDSYPNEAGMKRRLLLTVEDDLDDYLEAIYDPNERVATHLTGYLPEDGEWRPIADSVEER